MTGLWADQVRRWADTDRLALTVDDGSLSYRQWARDGDALARAFVGAGLEPGARIATLLPNSPELLTSLYACARVGITAVPLSTWASRGELHRVLGAARPDLVLSADTFPGQLSLLDDVLGGGAGPSRDGLFAWSDTGAAVPPISALLELGARVDDRRWRAAVAGARPESDFVVLYTSGSTGAPKGVVLDQGAVTRNAAAIAVRMGFAPGERVYSYFPLFFSGGLCNALSGCVAVGGELVTQARFAPAAAAELIHRRRCTARNVWHDGLTSVAESPVFTGDELRRMRKGLIVDPELLAAHGITDDLGVNMYGMTETATAFTCGDYRDSAGIRSRTHGMPLPGNEVRIHDPDSGREVPVGDQGEITVRGPNLMRGYTDGSDADTIDEDGFFHTGDVGLLDGDGHLRYLGRTKTMIKVKGLTVQPEEVESVLLACTGVRRAVVTGLGGGHESTGVGALIVLEPGECVTTAEVEAHCRRELSSYKVPRLRIVGDDEFPLSSSLKTDRIAARALWHEHSTGR